MLFWHVGLAGTLHRSLYLGYNTIFTLVSSKMNIVLIVLIPVILLRLMDLIGLERYGLLRDDRATNHRHSDVILNGFIPQETSSPRFSLLGQYFHCCTSDFSLISVMRLPP